MLISAHRNGCLRRTPHDLCNVTGWDGYNRPSNRQNGVVRRYEYYFCVSEGAPPSVLLSQYHIMPYIIGIPNLQAIGASKYPNGNNQISKFLTNLP